MVRIKRVYETPVRQDGVRVLVDRLWPRGLTKAKASVDLWLRELAPSNELRSWYAHDPDRWQEFRRRYLRELRDEEKRVFLAELRRMVRAGTVTLLFAAKDEQHSNAAVLASFLQRRVPRRT